MSQPLLARCGSFNFDTQEDGLPTRQALRRRFLTVNQTTLAQECCSTLGEKCVGSLQNVKTPCSLETRQIQPTPLPLYVLTTSAMPIESKAVRSSTTAGQTSRSAWRAQNVTTN